MATPREKAVSALQDAMMSLFGPQTGEDAVVAVEAAGLAIVDPKAVKSFLDACGDPSKCSSCGAPIWWFCSRNGKRWPITALGFNHFIDCPSAAEHKRDR